MCRTYVIFGLVLLFACQSLGEAKAKIGFPNVAAPREGRPSDPASKKDVEENLDPVKSGKQKVTAKQVVDPMDEDGNGKVSKDEWADVNVDLSKFAGKKIKLSLENRPNNWNCEWAYWNEISVVSE